MLARRYPSPLLLMLKTTSTMSNITVLVVHLFPIYFTTVNNVVWLYMPKRKTKNKYPMTECPKDRQYGVYLVYHFDGRLYQSIHRMSLIMYTPFFHLNPPYNQELIDYLPYDLSSYTLTCNIAVNIRSLAPIRLTGDSILMEVLFSVATMAQEE